jgi:pyridoxal phosphate enzyme (YggS family)
LQTNKVKDIIDKVELIQSVDSIKLAKEISKQAVKHNIVMDILLEVNIGGEESKWGFEPEDLLSSVKEISKFDNLRIKGLMAIPPICEKGEENRKYFRQMHKLFVDIGLKNIDNSSMDILSMGMSDDFDIAIEEGATMVRVGSKIFGARNYNI